MTRQRNSWAAHLRRLDIQAPGGEVFDPSSSAGCRVLEVSTEMTDRMFGTEDDTEYVITVRNTSQYYLALDVKVRISLPPEVAAATTPDGIALIELIPGEQHIDCLAPHAAERLRFRAITRGVAPDRYKIRLELDYAVVYWDGRSAFQQRTLRLPVGVAPRGIRVGMRRQPTNLEVHQIRRKAMSESYHNPGFDDESDDRAAPEELGHLTCQFALPHGGYVEVRYWLRKGTRPLCGCHPDTGSVESYFSTQDDATLELILENKSACNIRHARVSGVTLMSYVGDGNALQSPDTELQEPNRGETLPDGNPLIEILPGDAYYGHLWPDHPVRKHFSVITRGTAPGRYYICMRLDYSVDGCVTPVHLPLMVSRD